MVINYSEMLQLLPVTATVVSLPVVEGLGEVAVATRLSRDGLTALLLRPSFSGASGCCDSRPSTDR